MAVDLPPTLLQAVLARWPVGRLGTVTPRGMAHVLPVVFVAVAGSVYSPVDAKRKSGRTLARINNVEARGRASLLLDHYHDDWSELWWIRLEGAAWVERADTALLDRVERRLRAKYPQYRTLGPYTGEPMALGLRWQRVTAWTQSGDADPIRRSVTGG